jgi:hypothetical protein
MRTNIRTSAKDRHFYIATGRCVDKKGDVFVVDSGYRKIFEYAHGGTKRLVTLDSPTKDPVACAIDKATRPVCLEAVPPALHF